MYYAATTLTKTSFTSSVSLTFTTVLLLAGSLGSRNGFLDLLTIVGNGKFCCVASALLGDEAVPLSRLRNGLFEDRFKVIPLGLITRGGDGVCRPAVTVFEGRTNQCVSQRFNLQWECLPGPPASTAMAPDVRCLCYLDT